MTRGEFNAQRDHLSCQGCGQVGLVAVENPNNGGVRPGCPACDHPTPLPGVQWLRKSSAESRKVRRPSSAPTTDEVWEANGNVCAFCGKTRKELERFRIGLTIQHVIPFSTPGGSASPLIPFCARCQQASVAALAETRCLRIGLANLDETITMLGKQLDEALELTQIRDHQSGDGARLT